MSSKMCKAIVALLAVFGLVFATFASASASAPVDGPQTAGPEWEIQGPAGLDGHKETGAYLPWEHTVVVAYVSDGYTTIGEIDLLMDYSWLRQYVEGHRSFVVDATVMVTPKWVANDRWHYGDVSLRLPEQDTHGDVAVALNMARRNCDSSWQPCDIVLVTHSIPTDAVHRTHAMAEAMKIVAGGYRLHSVALPPTTCVASDADIGCDKPGDTPTNVSPDTAAFSRLLSATGYHVALDDHTLVLDVINDIMFAVQYSVSWYSWTDCYYTDDVDDDSHIPICPDDEWVADDDYGEDSPAEDG